MGASRTRLRGSGVARAEDRLGFARVGFLTLIFLIAGKPQGSLAEHFTYPYDYDFCDAFVPKAICEGDGAMDANRCATNTYGCFWDESTNKCSMSTADDATFDGALSGWFPNVDEGSPCHNKAQQQCSPDDGCGFYDGTCFPFPSTGVSLLSAHGAPDVIQAYYHSLRQSYYCPTVSGSCAAHAGCHETNSGCEYAFEFGVWEVVTTCESSGTTFTSADKNAIAFASSTVCTDWADLESFVTNNGLDYMSSYSSGHSPSGSHSEYSPKWPDPVEYCATWEVNAYCNRAHLDSNFMQDAAACGADPLCYWNEQHSECEQSISVPEPPALSYAQVWEYNAVFDRTYYASQYSYDVNVQYSACAAHTGNTTADATACEADLNCGVNYRRYLKDTPSGVFGCEINHTRVADAALADGAPYPIAMRNEMEAYHNQVCWKVAELGGDATHETACDAAGWRCEWKGMLNPDGCGPSVDSYTVSASNACVDYDPSGTFWSSLVDLPVFANLPNGVDGAFDRTGAERLNPKPYPGRVGCALTCEGWDVDRTRCASKPYYCRWSEERHKCLSAVGHEPCPESVPTTRWLPVSYASDATRKTRLADAFAESANAVVRVDWKGSPLAFLRVTRDVATFAPDLHDRLFVEWLDVSTTTHTLLNVDFELYSTYEDALARAKEARWTRCANLTSAPFPGGCAPDELSVSDYESLRLSETATHHAVFVESPAPVAFGDVFAPPLDSNQAEFTGSNAISAAGDLSLGGADAFTIRVRADVAGSVDANLLDVPGLISITTLGTDPDNYYKLRFTGLCEDASVTAFDGSAPFAGSTEIVVTYDGAYVKLYLDGDEQYSHALNASEPCAYPSVPKLNSASWRMGGASNSFDSFTYDTRGFLSYLTTWTGVSLSAQNVRRMSRADYRYVPRPTHHFNFDEGAGAVVRDHFPGVGGADTLRAHFGPTAAYRKMPSAPSLSAFLSDSSGAASVAVAKSKAYAHVYEGSFTMQAWFRADAELTETSHQVFGNYFRDTSGSSVPGGFFNLAAQPGSAGFYGLTLEYQSAGGAHVHASVLDGATPDARLEIGRWYHLAAQRDVEAGEARVFVDGVLKLQDTNVGYPARGLDWTGVDSDAWVADASGGLFLGGNAKDGAATRASFSDFQVYSAAVPPTFPTGPGVCAPPSAEFLVLWLPLDREGDQVDASGRGTAATAPAGFAEVAASAPAIDSYSRPPSTSSDAPCGPWGVYDGCAAAEPEACSACLRSAGFDTGECGMKAVGGVVTFEGGFTVHTFTRNETFAVLRDDLISVEVLAVGGGGGGGAVANAAGGAGGGGGGGVAADYNLTVSKGDAFEVVVGAGGAGASGDGQALAASGARSAFARFEADGSASASVEADGGAGGAAGAAADAAGGDGAMRAGWTMSQAGYNWRDFAGRALVSPVSGAPRAYAGGGGACVWDEGCSAGSATGGDAAPMCFESRCDAHQHSGGGGGAAVMGPAGNGADGVVIVRYQ